MDNFNYQAYLKSGRIHGDKAVLTESEQVSEKKYKQGYDDREDESLGARRGAEKAKNNLLKTVEMILTVNLVSVMLKLKEKIKAQEKIK